MIVIDATITIERPVEEVWDFLTDIEGMVAWQDEMLEASRETEGPTGVGSVFRYTRKVPFGKQSGTLEITEWEPHKRMTLRALPGPILPIATDELVADGERTIVHDHLEAEIRGPLRLLAPLLKASFEKQAAKHLAVAKEHLERADRATP